MNSHTQTTYQNTILPRRRTGNVALVPLRYSAIRNTIEPARVIEENSGVATIEKKRGCYVIVTIAIVIQDIQCCYIGCILINMYLPFPGSV